MIKNIFEINAIFHKVTNWKNKKKKLIEVLKHYPEVKEKHFSTNKSKPRNQIYTFVQGILREDFNAIANEVNMTMHINEIWSVTYNKFNFHNPHNHGLKGFSGILFIDYKPTDHEPPYFVCPFNNPFTGKSMISSPNVEEGDILITPSYLMHYTNVNTSSKPRRILGFDFEFEEK
jgi:hypothetical protein